MSIYCISDIHGNYEKYRKLLDKINFSDKDALVILGDVVDRGKHSMEILLDIMDRENVFMILGNHEQIALACLLELPEEITAEHIKKLDEANTEMLVEWLYNLGGQATLDSYKKQSKADRNRILDYLSEIPLYEEVQVNNKNYLLVHGGLDNFSPQKKFDDYEDDDLLWARMDYGMQYFDDIIIVSGHTPTRTIEENSRPDFIYKANNHIAIDCACTSQTGKLGCICLNTMEEFYV